MLTLRAIANADIPLLEKWLNNDYVKKWFELPEHDIYLEDWLYEVKNRDSEFSWLTHLIVELDGQSIGFAICYDCFDAQEKWYEVTAKGETYSIDYLIGNPSFLGRGYGKEIIRLLTERVRQVATANNIIVQPDSENKASCGVLKSNGFIFDKDKKYFVFKFNN